MTQRTACRWWQLHDWPRWYAPVRVMLTIDGKPVRETWVQERICNVCRKVENREVICN